MKFLLAGSILLTSLTVFAVPQKEINFTYKCSLKEKGERPTRILMRISRECGETILEQFLASEDVAREVDFGPLQYIAKGYDQNNHYLSYRAYEGQFLRSDYKELRLYFKDSFQVNQLKSGEREVIFNGHSTFKRVLGHQQTDIMGEVLEYKQADKSKTLLYELVKFE